MAVDVVDDLVKARLGDISYVVDIPGIITEEPAEERAEPGFSVANDPSNDPISQKIAKNVVSEKPN